MKLSQFHALADEAVRAEGERQAGMILAINLGSHGKKLDIERAIRKLSGETEKPMSIGDAQKLANKARGG